MTDDRRDWTRPKPERTPRPTTCPAFLAAGIVLFAYGFTFSGWFIALGGIMVIAAAAGWIAELRRDHD
ncbi:MAG: hypothetical protein KatS3mg060_1352 [Dehalococcoidia bacterium]|nr:MAG: hypothetical protein KatS3mg060_1352 [Dehalococcoidia bacterium]